MSSITKTPWRIPNFVVHTALSPLLANERLHDALVHTAQQPVQEHGAGSHTDRNFVDFVGAEAFSGAAAIVDGTPVRTFTDGLDLTYYATARIPKGILTATPGLLDAMMYILVPAGVNGAISYGMIVETFRNGSTIAATVPGLTEAAIAVQPSDVVMRLQAGVGAPAATDEFVRISARRNAGAVQDVLNADVHLVGAYLLWGTDE